MVSALGRADRSRHPEGAPHPTQEDAHDLTPRDMALRGAGIVWTDSYPNRAIERTGDAASSTGRDGCTPRPRMTAPGHREAV